MTDTDPTPAAGLTDADLDEIEARANAATPGPWDVSDGNEGDWPPRPLWMVTNEAFHNPPADDDTPWIAAELHTGVRDDAEFVAAARTDVPRLLAEVRRLRAALASLPAATDTPEVGCG